MKEAGAKGVFPKYVTKRVYEIDALGLEYYDVSRRIVRMNKHLRLETGERLFENRGHKWALTSFAFEAWGELDVEEKIPLLPTR